MPEPSIQITGIAELDRKLGAAARNDVLMPPMQRATSRIMQRMQKYPPTRPGQTYRRGQDPRSEDLGGKWTTKITKDAFGLVGKVGNNVTYAPWVVSKQFQAWMHRGRWQTDASVVEELRDVIRKDFNDAIHRALNGPMR